jgi:hypothetical protein
MPDPRKRIPMIVVGNDSTVRALMALSSDTIVCVSTIAQARTLLLRGGNFLKGDDDTVIAYTADFVASFETGAPESLVHGWRSVVLTTGSDRLEGQPFTAVALGRLRLAQKDIISVPMERDRLDAFLATNAGGAA